MTDDTGGVAAAVALLVCLAAVAATVPAVTAAAPAVGGSPDDASGDPLHKAVETDEISIEVTAEADGDATWRIEYRVELGADGNATEAFESLAADVRANPENYTDRFADRITSTVRSAENATGREMAATNFTVETETTPIYGIVAYTFDWSNFSNVTAPDRLVVGDAIGGFVMNADTQLLIRWPQGWTATDVTPDPDARGDRLVRWAGATTDFTADQPRVVIRSATGTPTATATATGTVTSDPGATTGSPDTTAVAASGGGGFPVGVLVLLALVVAGLGIAWWRFSDAGAGPTAPPGSDDGPAPGDGAAAADPGDGDDPDGAEPDEADEPDGDGAPIDEELLSNEERVLRVLEENGGRAKQQEVVEALGWTEAKTSQVVSGMREEGTIDGFRLGRENVLTLPEEEIDPTEAEGDGGT